MRNSNGWLNGSAASRASIRISNPFNHLPGGPDKESNERMPMNRMRGKSLVATVLVACMATATLGQGQRGGATGGAPGAAAAAGGRGNAAPAPGPKALIPDAKPVR